VITIIEPRIGINIISKTRKNRINTLRCFIERAQKNATNGRTMNMQKSATICIGGNKRRQTANNNICGISRCLYGDDLVVVIRLVSIV